MKKQALLKTLFTLALLSWFSLPAISAERALAFERSMQAPGRTLLELSPEMFTEGFDSMGLSTFSEDDKGRRVENQSRMVAVGTLAYDVARAAYSKCIESAPTRPRGMSVGNSCKLSPSPERRCSIEIAKVLDQPDTKRMFARWMETIERNKIQTLTSELFEKHFKETENRKKNRKGCSQFVKNLFKEASTNQQSSTSVPTQNSPPLNTQKYLDILQGADANRVYSPEQASGTR